MAWKFMQYNGENRKKRTVSSVTHNYSITEQVVGTWIDGSTVYERTFVFDPALSLPYNTWVHSDYVLGNGWKIVGQSFTDNFGGSPSLNTASYSSEGKLAFFNVRNATISLVCAVLQYIKT